MGFFNRTNQRKSRVRKEVAKQFADLSRLADVDVIYSSAIWLLFVLLSVVAATVTVSVAPSSSVKSPLK